MAYLDHDAVFKAYPTIVTYDDSFGLYDQGKFDKRGKC
jgi:hypothetical protein